MPIIEHPIHIKPEPELVLWRYISIAKYESLLKEGALFFCYADKFKDPFECSIPRLEVDFRLSERKFRAEAESLNKFDRVFDIEKARLESEIYAGAHQRFKRATTVNCWHINNHESNAMWSLYIKNNEGLAIKTTTINLSKSLNEAPEGIGMSKVRYIDYDNQGWFNEIDYPVRQNNMLIPVVHKRIEFSQEQELRLYNNDIRREATDFWINKEPSQGEFIKVDVKELIESIVFHPTSDDSVKQKIKSITEQYGFDFQFDNSRLSVDPRY